MSDKDLDKLFKAKLEDLQSSPSPAAWDQISSEIEGKKSGAIWWKVAAAVLLLMSIGMVVRWSLPVDDPQIAQTNTVEEETITDKAQDVGESEAAVEQEEVSDESELNKDEPAELIEETPAQEPVHIQENLAYSPNTKETNDGEQLKEMTSTDEPELIAESGNDIAAINETPDVADELIEELPTEEEVYTSTTVAVTGSTLSYSIDQFESAQISDEEITEEYTEEKQEKGIRKIFGLLQQVKEPDNGLGDLRSMKNELFARGKSKKERSNP